MPSDSYMQESLVDTCFNLYYKLFSIPLASYPRGYYIL
jgi:hypothetical protein